MLQGECSVEGCERPVARGGYCWGHRKRIARRINLHRPLGRRYCDPWEAVMNAVFGLLAVDETEDADEEWQRAIERLRGRIKRYRAANPNQHRQRVELPIPLRVLD